MPLLSGKRNKSSLHIALGLFFRYLKVLLNSLFCILAVQNWILSEPVFNWESYIVRPSSHFPRLTFLLPVVVFSQLIQKHNSEGHSYSLAMNEFGDLTVEEYRSLFPGSTSCLYQETKRQGSFFSLSSGVTQLPDTVDWRTKGYVTPVKNQGKLPLLVS